MFIKASLALVLLVSVKTRAQFTTGACVDNTFLCKDCTSLNACFGGQRYLITCTTGQVCGNDGSDPAIDGCFDIADSSNTEQSQCSCDASATDPSYIADGNSADPAAYLACLPGSSLPESLTCTSPETFIEGQNPPCGVAPSPTTPGPTTTPPTTPAPFECSSVLSSGESGFVADPNDCSTYWLCASDTDTNPTEASCPAGESFNEGTLACFDPCDSSAETFSCDGITGGVPDSVDCTIFHICVNGAAVGVPVPCGTGEIFDEAAGACVTGTTCASTGNACLTCPTTVAPSTVSGASAATSATGDSTDITGASTATSVTGASTGLSGASTATSATDASTDASGPADTDSSASGSDTSITPTDSGVTGVPDCNTASQAGYYETAACNNVFYSCEDDDAGGYVLKKYTCPGSLVFDTVNNYCNLDSLVSGC